MAGDRIGSLLLQWFTPVLIAPLTCVGGVNTDYCDPAAGGHRGQPVPEPRSRDGGDGAPEGLPALAAAHGFPAGDAGLGEVEVLHRNRRTPVLLCGPAATTGAAIRRIGLLTDNTVPPTTDKPSSPQTSDSLSPLNTHFRAVFGQQLQPPRLVTP
jgi:hypothetical protein